MPRNLLLCQKVTASHVCRCLCVHVVPGSNDATVTGHVSFPSVLFGRKLLVFISNYVTTGAFHSWAVNQSVDNTV